MGWEDAPKTEETLPIPNRETGEVNQVGEPSEELALAQASRRELVHDLWLPPEGLPSRGATPVPTMGGTPLEPASFRGALLHARTESYTVASIREALDEGLPFWDDDPTEVDDHNPFEHRGRVQRSPAAATDVGGVEGSGARSRPESDEGEVVVTGIGAYAPRPASETRERAGPSVLRRLPSRPVQEVDHLDNHRRISTGEPRQGSRAEDASTLGSGGARRSS